MNYYNESDPFAANWLRELIANKLIPAGDVDDRSIEDVEPQDLDGYTQCHFFAGIGGWSYALQLAGWRPDEPVWTGSCPCQPFSSAGKGLGTDDPRHLWPVFRSLIAECRPATVFGEQVASKAGRAWLAGVFADLEDMGYAVAGADLCAAGVGAPHIRQRLFWVADAGCQLQEERDKQCEARGEVRGEGGVCGCVVVRRGLGDPFNPRLEGHAEHGNDGNEPGRIDTNTTRPTSATGWDSFDIVRCLEPTKEPGRYVEKRRRVESGTLPLAHGLPARVGRLRGYGNAIVPQVAAEFTRAYTLARTPLETHPTSN